MEQLSEKLTPLYTLFDYPSPREQKKLNVCVMHPVRDIRAMKIGEFREPKKGEWYISGAEPEAFKAPNDLTTKFWIARLVMTQTKMVIQII